MSSLKLNLFVFIGLILFVSAGCAERRLIIYSEPTGAKVLVDDEEKGVTPTTVNFTYYGTREITLSKEGYQTFKTHASIKPPLLHIFPFDALMFLIPYPISDDHILAYEIKPYQPPLAEELMKRVQILKEQLNNELSRQK
ncbi:MAG: PEGA domain-containing protein [Planctomycetota bacterium]